MKKIIPVLLATAIIMLLPSIKTEAVTATTFGYYIRNRGNGEYNYHILAYDFDHFFVYNGNPVNSFYYCQDVYSATVYDYQSAIDACNSFIQDHNVSNYNPTDRDGIPENLSSGQTLYVYNIPYSYLPDNAVDITPDPQEPKWYSEMWDTLKQALGDPAFWFGEWFINLIEAVYENDENDPTGPPKPPLSTHVTINNPTITPAPTPIPYSTIIVPKTDPVSGNTYYETNYIYNNPSGNPIVVTTPPSQPNSTGCSGNGSDYTPLGGDPYSIPQLSWLTNGVLTDDNNNSIDGIGSISDGMDSIDAIGSDYTDGMGAVQDATGTLPTSWLLLIGIAAAIPLIAGIISRFLS